MTVCSEAIPTTRRLGRGLAAAIVLVTLATGCRSTEEAPALPRPNVMQVAMREFSLGGLREVPAGRTVIQARNLGERPHRLILLALPEDFPPILDQFRGSQRRPANPLAAVTSASPGGSQATAVDLVPGRYALFCPITGKDGVTFASKGMASEFRVTK